MALKHHPWRNEGLADGWGFDGGLTGEDHLLALNIFGLVGFQTLHSTQFASPRLSLTAEVVWTFVQYPKGHG